MESILATNSLKVEIILKVDERIGILKNNDMCVSLRQDQYK